MKDSLKSLLSFTTPLLLLMACGWYFGANWLLWTAGIFLVAGFLWPKGRGLFIDYWMRLAHFLGRINAAIILSLVFVAIVIPLGLVMRRGSRLSQSLRQNNGKSAFTFRNLEFAPPNFETPW